MVNEGKKVFSFFSKLVDFFSEYSAFVLKTHVSSCKTFRMEGQLESMCWKTWKCNRRIMLGRGGICNWEKTGGRIKEGYKCMWNRAPPVLLLVFWFCEKQGLEPDLINDMEWADALAKSGVDRMATAVCCTCQYHLFSPEPFPGCP